MTGYVPTLVVVIISAVRMAEEDHRHDGHDVATPSPVLPDADLDVVHRDGGEDPLYLVTDEDAYMS
jgi:hypothetical protein